MSNLLSIATSADVVKRSLKVAVIVGTALVAINQGDALLAGTITPELMWKIPMTYLVPCVVSSYVATSAIAKHEQK
jgi:hypothetical protein